MKRIPPANLKDLSMNLEQNLILTRPQTQEFFAWLLLQRDRTDEVGTIAQFFDPDRFITPTSIAAAHGCIRSANSSLTASRAKDQHAALRTALREWAILTDTPLGTGRGRAKYW